MVMMMMVVVVITATTTVTVMTMTTTTETMTTTVMTITGVCHGTPGTAWGQDDTGAECQGCGPQYELRNCADIAITSAPPSAMGTSCYS